MIEPLQIATLGTYPGFTTFHLATLGHKFKIKISVVPSYSDIDYSIPDLRRRISVEVFYNNHQWEQIIFINPLLLDKTIMVYSSFLSVIKKIKEIRIISELRKIFITSKGLIR